MIQADCHPGVAAGKLDSTIENLRDLLSAYRSELSRTETAFEQWEIRWNEREREIDQHLSLIQARLDVPHTQPALTLVRADE